MSVRLRENSQRERTRIRRFVRNTSVLVTVLLSVLMATILVLHVARARSAQWTNHAHDVGRVGREALLSAGDRQAALRGDRVAHDGATLDLQRATASFHARLDSLIALTVDNPYQNALARAARDAAQRELRDSDSGAAVQARVLLSRFVSEEARLYDRRLSNTNRLLVLMPLSTLAGSLILLAGLGKARRLLVRQTNGMLAHREAAARLAEQLGQQNEELRQQASQMEEQAIELEEQQGDLEHSLELAREERERFASLLTSMYDTVYAIDLEQRLTEVYLSRDMERQWDVPATLGRRAADVVGPEGAEAHEEAGRVALGGTPVSFDWTASLQGRRYHYETTLAPLRDANSRIVGAVGVTRDQTAAHERQVAMADTENRLRQAQKLEAIGQLAGGVAHDFNNLLTVIISYTELLSTAARLDDDRQALDEIRNASLRAAALTKQLLAFSRREAVQIGHLDLCNTIRGVEELLRRMVGTDVTLEFALAPEASPVLADAGQVGQVLMNLVVNANAAMPRGGTIRVGVTVIDLDESFAAQHVGMCVGPHYEISVTDTGVGMSEDTRARIFEPFFTTKPAGEGTGLGLATVYGIIRAWDGCIDVESVEGQGTIFRLYVPCAEATPVGEPAPAGSAGVPAATPPALMECGSDAVTTGSARILLVDDDDSVRAVAARILRSAGHDVLEAQNGTDALRVLDAQDQPVALIVSDMVMPGMGGRDLAFEVRIRYPDAGLVLMSGYTREILPATDALRQAAVFLDKPFTRASLTDAVARALAAVKAPVAPRSSLLPQRAPATDERALDILSNGIDAVVWEGNGETGQLDYVSRRIESLLGYSRARWADPEFRLLMVHPDDLGRVREQGQRAIASLEGFSAEYRVRAANGAMIWVRNVVGVMVSPQHGGVRFRGVMVDIDAIKRSAEAVAAANADLARQHRFLTAVLESLHDGVAACDQSARLTLFNDAMVELVGRPLATIPPEERPAYYAVHHPDGSGPLDQEEMPMLRALRHGEVNDCALLIRRPDGEPRRVVANGRAIRDEQGRAIGAVVALHDMTRIETMIAELRAAKEVAERAAQARTRFLSLVSHELNTPLNAVIGFADVLRRNRWGTLHATELTYLERIAANARRLFDIVRDVLDITAADAGTLTVDQTTVALPGALWDALDPLLPIATTKGLALETHIPEVVAPIVADPARLRQVLATLIDNAIRYTEAGRVTVRVIIDAAAHEEVGRVSRIEIEDTGPGIPPEYLEAVFEPFVQRHDLVERTHGGAGTGLAVARTLCEAMGFSLTLASTVGVGTRCIIDLDGRAPVSTTVTQTVPETG